MGDAYAPVDYARSFTHERPRPETDPPTERAVSADRITNADWLELKNRITYALQGDNDSCCLFSRKHLYMIYRMTDIMMGLDLPKDLLGEMSGSGSA